MSLCFFLCQYCFYQVMGLQKQWYTTVYYLHPKGVQSMDFMELGPSVTLECGAVGTKKGVDDAERYLDASLHLLSFAQRPPPLQDFDLYHTVAVVKVRPEVSLGVEEGQLALRSDIDHLNFQLVPSGSCFAKVDPAASFPVQVTNEGGKEVTDRHFHLRDGELCLREPMMPAMLTCDLRVIRQDCLCYLMESYPLTSS
jgi:hypothetical protein